MSNTDSDLMENFNAEELLDSAGILSRKEYEPLIGTLSNVLEHHMSDYEGLESVFRFLEVINSEEFEDLNAAYKEKEFVNDFLRQLSHVNRNQRNKEEVLTLCRIFNNEFKEIYERVMSEPQTERNNLFLSTIIRSIGRLAGNTEYKGYKGNDRYIVQRQKGDKEKVLMLLEYYNSEEYQELFNDSLRDIMKLRDWHIEVLEDALKHTSNKEVFYGLIDLTLKGLHYLEYGDKNASWIISEYEDPEVQLEFMNFIKSIDDKKHAKKLMSVFKDMVDLDYIEARDIKDTMDLLKDCDSKFAQHSIAKGVLGLGYTYFVGATSRFLSELSQNRMMDIYQDKDFVRLLALKTILKKDNEEIDKESISILKDFFKQDFKKLYDNYQDLEYIMNLSQEFVGLAKKGKDTLSELSNLLDNYKGKESTFDRLIGRIRDAKTEEQANRLCDIYINHFKKLFDKEDNEFFVFSIINKFEEDIDEILIDLVDNHFDEMKETHALYSEEDPYNFQRPLIDKLHKTFINEDKNVFLSFCDLYKNEFKEFYEKHKDISLAIRLHRSDALDSLIESNGNKDLAVKLLEVYDSKEFLEVYELLEETVMGFGNERDTYPKRDFIRTIHKSFGYTEDNKLTSKLLEVLHRHKEKSTFNLPSYTESFIKSQKDAEVIFSFIDLSDFMIDNSDKDSRPFHEVQKLCAEDIDRIENKDDALRMINVYKNVIFPLRLDKNEAPHNQFIENLNKHSGIELKVFQENSKDIIAIYDTVKSHGQEALFIKNFIDAYLSGILPEYLTQVEEALNSGYDIRAGSRKSLAEVLI